MNDKEHALISDSLRRTFGKVTGQCADMLIGLRRTDKERPLGTFVCCYHRNIRTMRSAFVGLLKQIDGARITREVGARFLQFTIPGDSRTFSISFQTSEQFVGFQPDEHIIVEQATS